MADDELMRILRELVAEIAEKEKVKAVASGDYGAAFVAALIEGWFREPKASNN